MVEFHALGGVRVSEAGRDLNVGGPQQRRLLAMLLVHRNSVLSTDRLIDTVFAGEPSPAAATTLRSYIARLRKVLDGRGDSPALVTQAPGYVLKVADDGFDVARFEANVAEARSLSASGEPAAAVGLLQSGLALWRGDAFAEFDDEEWARSEAQRLAELRLVAHELLFEAELACGRSSEVIPEIEVMAARDPLREGFVAQLMTAYYRAGRQADALRAYQDHRAVLVEELGLDPAPALQELEERILTHDPGLLEPPEGRVLRGYRLGERLGTGRDGTAFAAHLPGVDRELVVREFRREVSDDPDFVRAFEATAQRLAALRHPAIVPIHDYWREPGAAYLVMRRLPGGSLADRLARRDRRPVDASEMAAVVRRIGGALAAAAEAGVTHGRIDATAVLFDDRGDAWLGDFDLGRMPGTGSSEPDGRGLVDLVRECLPAVDGGVTDDVSDAVGERGDRTGAPIADVVARLVAALVDERPAAVATRTNPYKGLRAFDESDAGDFFGRSSVVAELLDRLSDDSVRGRLMLVVGGSGTGKSSTVRAGLLPLVRRGDVDGSDRWFVTTMLPGAAPFKELAVALRRVAVSDRAGITEDLAEDGGIDRVVRELVPDGQVLLVIDQLEELFTATAEREQRRFLGGIVDAIHAPGSRLRVIGTLRADFFDRPLAVQPFGGLVLDATVTVPAMSAAELEAAIVEPARRAGLAVEGPLVAELVSAAVDEPAGLPALQFTLFELAEQCDGDLTLDAYRRLGGLSGAIASRAEALYQSLDDDERSAVRRLFEHLVIWSADGEPTKRRAIRAEVTAGDAALEGVVDRWADARLLTLDHHRQSRLPTVEPAHEALLREWPRLRRWLEENRGALVLLAHLREAAASWEELDRDPGALYRGARLQSAADGLGGTSLGASERAFLDASLDARAAEELEITFRAERQARANRRLRWQLVGIGFALVIALIGGFVALDQRGEAVDERRVAFARELSAAADANLAEDAERSLLLSLAAVEQTRDGDAALPEAIGALHEALSRSRILLSVPGVGGDVAWSPDGSVFVTEGPEDTGLIDIRDAATGETVASWVGHDIDMNAVAFDRTGQVVATSGDDGYVRVWEVDSGDEVASFFSEGQVWGPTFSPDGHLVAAAWDRDGTQEVRVYDIEREAVVFAVERPNAIGAGFSPDGRRLVVASREEAGLLVVDVPSGREVLRFGAESGVPTNHARYSPDGRWIAAAYADGKVRVWDAETGELGFVVGGHSSEVSTVEWSADGRRLVSAGYDGTARVYDVIEGGVDPVAVLSARDTANGLMAAVFSPDGDRVMTGDAGIASVLIWDVSAEAGAELASLDTAVDRLARDTFSPDGENVLLVTPDGRLSRWDVETGEEVATPVLDGVDGPIFALSPSPDGEVLAVHSSSGLSLHDASTGRLVWRLPLEESMWVPDVVWSADGEHLAYVLEADVASIAVVDRSGAELATFEVGQGWGRRKLAFVGDGDRLAEVRAVERETPSAIGVRVWDWREGSSVLDIQGLASDVSADPTGDRLAFANVVRGEVEVWDVRAGERLRTLRAAGPVAGVTWSPDGRRISIAGADGTVRVHDADSGRLELILRGHSRGVRSTAFSPDGTRLISGADGGEVRVWTLDLDELVDIARTRLTRGLDDDECRQYLRAETCS